MYGLIREKPAMAAKVGDQMEELETGDDPIEQVQRDFGDDGLDLDFEDGIYNVSGSFSNPLPIAARAATALEKHEKIPLVHARSNGRWAFIVWRRPDLLVATAPAGNAWRLYRASGLSTPTSLLASGDGLSSIGLVGKPTRIGQLPPQKALDLLTEAGLDYVSLVADLTGR